MKIQKFNYSNTTPLPHNFLAEESILNILLTHPKLVKKTLINLKSDSFYFEPHKIIYSILSELDEENKPITLTLLITKLQDKALLNQIGGIERIIQIINKFENLLNLDEYIQAINEKYLRRLIIEFGKQTIIWGYTTSFELDDILTRIEKLLFDLNQQNLSQKTYSIAEVLDEVFLEMTSKIKNKESSGLFSSFRDLDSIIQGFQNSDLIIIAGRPSMGKTAFALNLGSKIVSKYKIPLIVFTLEMSRQQIIYRFLATHSQINYTRLKSGKMTRDEWNLLSNSMRELSTLPIFVDDNPNLSVTDIRSRLRTIFSSKKKEGLILIDYLQLMKSNFSNDNRVQEISYITRNLKILAKEFELPIILLSQLSRSVESRNNKRPLLSDLRESGSIEQDADIVIMLYRDDYYNEIRTNVSITEFIVAKHRNGPLGTAKLNFNNTTTTFTNV
jgi:replicative DNA helicase